MEFGWSLLNRQPGKDFNGQRKVFRKAVGPQSLSRYDSLVIGEAETLVKNLSGFSGDPTPKFERYANAHNPLSLPDNS